MRRLIAVPLREVDESGKAPRLLAQRGAQLCKLGDVGERSQPVTNDLLVRRRAVARGKQLEENGDRALRVESWQASW